MWVGMKTDGRGFGLQRLVGESLEPFAAPGLDVRALDVWALHIDHEGALWVGTESQGLYRIHGNAVDHFASADGLSGDKVVQILEDREGTIWVATWGGGLDRFRDIGVVRFGAREGLGTDVVDTVMASRDGTVWAGGEHALAAIRGERVSSIRTGHGLPGGQVASLLEDRAGRLWVGVDDELTILRDGRFRRIDIPAGMVVGLAEDVDDSVWAEIRATPRKLIRINEDRVREVFPVPRVPLARRLTPDPEGGVWLGLASGDLARLRGGVLESFSFSNDPSRVPDVYTIGQIIAGRDRSILAASSYGLIGWRNGVRRLLTVRNGLPCDVITGLVEDRGGGLWLATPCGLLGLAPGELDEWWKDPNVQVHPRVLDVSDGWLPGLGQFQAAARSPDGRLWFANGTLLQMVDPEHLPRTTIAPPVHIVEVVADGRILPSSAGLRLPALTRDLQISYTALSLAVPEKIRFRYRLEGHDTDWVDPGTRRQAFYNDLGPGDYRFRVIACNNDGVWNETGASLDFLIAPAYYQTAWFRVVCVGAFLTLLAALYQLRLREVTQQLRQRMESRLEERERIARDLHDTLLQSVQGLILKVDAAAKQIPSGEAARLAIETTLDHADQVLAEGRDRVRNLRAAGASHHDLPAAFQQVAQESPHTHPVALKTVVEGLVRELHPLVLEESYSIGREALLNALTHSGAPHVEVEITYDPKQFRLRVRDDGRGVESRVLEEGGRPGHWGLPGMRERARKMGAQLELWSRPGSGTEVELTVPAAVAYRGLRDRARWFWFRHPPQMS
jgi:signal transduction histidine kinase